MRVGEGRRGNERGFLGHGVITQGKRSGRLLPTVPAARRLVKTGTMYNVPSFPSGINWSNIQGDVMASLERCMCLAGEGGAGVHNYVPVANMLFRNDTGNSVPMSGTDAKL